MYSIVDKKELKTKDKIELGHFLSAVLVIIAKSWGLIIKESQALSKCFSKTFDPINDFLTYISIT